MWSLVKVVMGVVGSFTVVVLVVSVMDLRIVVGLVTAVVMVICCLGFYDFSFNRMEAKSQKDR